MDVRVLEKLLEDVQQGRVAVGEALERLRSLPFENLGFACVDHHRHLRQGFPEVIFAEGKPLEQIRAILASLWSRSDRILITRLDPGHAGILARDFPEAR